MKKLIGLILALCISSAVLANGLFTVRYTYQGNVQFFQIINLVPRGIGCRVYYYQQGQQFYWDVTVYGSSTSLWYEVPPGMNVVCN